MHRGRLQRVQPVRDPVLHVRERDVADRPADREEEAAGEQVPDPSAGDPEQHDEHAEEEHRGAEVAFEEQDREGGTPREQQRAEILRAREAEPSDARLEELALGREERGQEDDDQDLPELGRLERDRPEVGPQTGSVHGQPDPGDDRQEQEDQAEQADRVRVAVEDAVVADEHEGQHERGQADQQPERLFVRDVGGQEPVDHREPESSQHPGDREEHGIRPRCRPSHGAPRQEVRDAEREAVHDDVARHAPAEPEPHHAVGGDRHDERDQQQHQPGPRPRRACGDGAHGLSPPPWSASASRSVCSARRTSRAICAISAAPSARSSTGIPSSKLG